jgi:cyanophycinase
MRPAVPNVARLVLLLASALALFGCSAPGGLARPGSSATGAQVHDGYTYYRTGDLAAPTPGTRSMGLMLMGGGDWPEDAFRWLVRKAGHGHIVILRASYGDELQRRLVEQIGGVASVQTFVFNSRAGADDPFVLDALRGADGVFIAGGDQSRYIRFWKGTGVNRVLDEHVRAGKPLGGTSAGLAILGASSYGALDGGSLDSRRALNNPLGKSVTIDTDFLHLPYLHRVVTDSHFAERNRLGRLIAFLAKAAQEQQRDDLVGIGVDEDTALCIDDEGIARVFSRKNGHAWLVTPTRPADVAEPGKALTYADISVTGIGVESRLDLNALSVQAPAFENVAHVLDGELSLGE